MLIKFKSKSVQHITLGPDYFGRIFSLPARVKSISLYEKYDLRISDDIRSQVEIIRGLYILKEQLRLQNIQCLLM